VVLQFTVMDRPLKRGEWLMNAARKHGLSNRRLLIRVLPGRFGDEQSPGAQEGGVRPEKTLPSIVSPIYEVGCAARFRVSGTRCGTCVIMPAFLQSRGSPS
jgi:hypothetical protein